MNTARCTRLGVALCLGLVACNMSARRDDARPHESPTCDPARLLAHITKLSSDEFEGRSPGTRGEELTVAYLTNELKKLGLAPGNPDGTYVQDVPLAGIKTHATGEIAVGDKTITLHSPDDCVLTSRRQTSKVDVESSELVFAGYAVVAPNEKWDDFKGVDVRGKTLVVLINDPPVPDPKDPTKLDESVFGGRAMTYYGRWTYKYEIAAEKGAFAVLIVHETEAAAYPFQVVQSSWGRENFDTASETKGADHAMVEGWLRLDTARALFTACGQDFDALKKAALSRDFAPVALGARATFHVQNEVRTIASKNVVALCRGADPKHQSEHVIYTAHWDHFGRDPEKGIYHGAVDNASGCASVLEIARLWSASASKSPRSALFLFVTGEERGLLGSRWYATHPLYPLATTACDINIDSTNPWGRTADVVDVGYGHSSLDDVLVAAAAARGRAVTADPEPEKGHFFRSDHFEFAKVGVPSLFAGSGELLIGQAPDRGKFLRDEFVAHDYHQPSDVVKPDWDLAGAADNADLLFDVGRRVALDAQWPRWSKSSEFQRAAAR